MNHPENERYGCVDYGSLHHTAGTDWCTHWDFLTVTPTADLVADIAHEEWEMSDVPEGAVYHPAYLNALRAELARR